MLSKEEVREIISYCNNHGVTRRTRLMELGILCFGKALKRFTPRSYRALKAEEKTGKFANFAT